jgi:pantoate--beta-alanine ligase
MVRDLHVDIDVVGAPIVREDDGLAMSSRNRHLDPAERAAALCLVRALDAAEACVAAGERDTVALVEAANAVIALEPRARAEYVVAVDPDTLAPAAEVAGPVVLALAVWIGSTRLIDNRQLTVPAVHRERRSA